MTEQITLLTPSEILAKQIADRFVHEELATKEFLEEIQRIILSLSPTPEDWQLLVEKILETQSKGE